MSYLSTLYPGGEREESGIPASQSFTKGWLNLMSRCNEKLLLLDHNSVLSPLFLPL